MQIEDLKTVPEEAPKSAADLALEALMRGKASADGPVVVNNLNSLVKKKKPAPAAAAAAPAPTEVTMPADAVEAIADEAAGAKRAAEEAEKGEGEPVAKKAKVADEAEEVKA